MRTHLLFAMWFGWTLASACGGKKHPASSGPAGSAANASGLPQTTAQQPTDQLGSGNSSTVVVEGPRTRAACEGVTLTASVFSQPRRWVDGERTLLADMQFPLPATIAASGNCENHWLELELQSAFAKKLTDCRYGCDATGTEYAFQNCNTAVAAGDLVSANFLFLHLNTINPDGDGTMTATVTLADPRAPACACQPLTCAGLGLACGFTDDGCGGILSCGACTTPQSACFGFDLVASETHGPQTWTDAAQTFGDPIQISVPGLVPITQGAASGTGSATLTCELMSGDVEQCLYVATPADIANFVFDSCSLGDAPGSLVTVAACALHVDDGQLDPSAASGATGPTFVGPTTVAVRLNAQPCECQPTTCAALGATCAILTDGCSGLLACGQCAEGLVCGGDPAAPLSCACAPKTCAQLGAECGAIDDGCSAFAATGSTASHVLSCGDCPAPDSCGASGVANRCGCAPIDCSAIPAAAGAKTCGLVDNLCGSFTDCGTCDAGEACIDNVCACKPLDCTELGFVCGAIDTGCGSTVSCGSCPALAACDAITHQCVGQETFGSSDPSIVGSAVVAPTSDAEIFNAQGDPTIPVNTLLSSTLGPVVTVGPVVNYFASGATVFGATPTCTELVLSFDQDLVNRFSPASLSSLRVYQVTTGTNGIQLVPVNEPIFVDAADGTVRFCTPHLSGYVVALQVNCAVTVVSPTTSIPDGSTAPALANSDWTISSANNNLTAGGVASFDEVSFAPPRAIDTIVSNDSPGACVGALLFYGGSTCPAGSPGQLCHVCAYDNAQYGFEACYAPFDKTITTCPGATGELQRRECFDVIYGSDVTNPPEALGKFAAFAGVVDGQAAWVDTRQRIDNDDQTVRSDSASVYNLSVWLTKDSLVGTTPGGVVGTLGLAGVASLSARMIVESVPHICIQDQTSQLGDRCGQVSDGCGSQIACGGCNNGLLCSTEGFCVCPPSGCPVTVQTCSDGPVTIGVCQIFQGCDSNPRLTSKPDGTFCGDTDGCNGVELCFGGGCQGGVAPIVDDGDPCTDDSCPPGAAGPVHSVDVKNPGCSGAGPQCFAAPQCDANDVGCFISHAPDYTLQITAQPAFDTTFGTQRDAAVQRLRNNCPTCGI